ncbi:tRNA 2-thiouridine(34) synthase MnmA [Clostridium sp. MSJ-11]|uniref:tRNA-specific 2-thiouridylase MnmA n=1 Tax=Clostridium mobile TaxID=2841512 RepID=A0ABS6EI96_9CLOT|nr:tRNA 2-thiouridine(34) synthase MnmA [Clostridium mobile]MBU5484936.1 tRNA 2-thiouridine(34) synthase MnmA [Clostridium mobile]
MKKKVFVGMSGGVDSSVTAHLLKKQGYEVVGMTMKVFPGNKCNNGLTESEMIIENARKVCKDLNIEFVAVDLIEEFNDKVVDYFMNEYVNGRTPNPCVQCNKYIKFDVFLKKALELGADYIATGHYSKVNKIEDRYLIYRGDDERKDQSYMFYNLQQHQLKHVLMPCGDYTKSQIREIAKEIGLEVHNKKDSEEICFIPDNNHGRFILENYKGNIQEGEFVDKNGKVLGKHKGLMYYTIGQRKGLGIALGKPSFVIDIIPSKNQVVIGDEEEIFKRELIAKDFNFIPFDKLENKMKVEAKIRYAAKPSPATIEVFDGNKLKVIFDEPQRAITKGQSVVFYLENLLLGGGIIDSIL